MRYCIASIILLSIFKHPQAQINHSFVIGSDLGIGANFGNSSKLSIGGSV
jgi:hypothetical protein